MIGELFQLTVWLPVTPAKLENGCLKFVCGTQNKIRNIRLGGKKGFYAVNFRFEFEPNPEDIVPVVGEVPIFSERTVHGSDENRANCSRLAFNDRVVSANAQVYPRNKKKHRAVQMAEDFDPAKWRAVRLRGEVQAGPNRTVDWQEYAR